jgi:TPR repeat protein
MLKFIQNLLILNIALTGKARSLQAYDEAWLQQAAESGNKDALSLFGMALATGKAGCRKDLELGKKYLTQAADQGDEQCLRMLDLINNEVGIFAKNKRSMGKKRPSAH